MAHSEKDLQETSVSQFHVSNRFEVAVQAGPFNPSKTSIQEGSRYE